MDLGAAKLSTRLAVLGTLYLVQGLPFGFQATALPVLLRRQGSSLEAIGLAGALSLPWMLKLLWAPWVDTRYAARLGRRRSWILPCQLGLALSALAAAALDPSRSLEALMALVLAMNVFAATMDVAVDGLAVELLAPSELGPGNAAQVVGFKLGMVTTGGLLLASVSTIGWAGLFVAVAAITGAVLLVTLLWRESGSRARGARKQPGEAAREEAESPRRESVPQVLRALWASVRAPGAVWALSFIGTYKIGEAAADAMFKPFLVDAGYDEAAIGLWVGTYGMAASLCGSLAGGFAARRMSALGAVGLASALRIGPMLGQWALAVYGADEARVLAVTLAEHFFGGALTTSMFAFMMSQVDRRIGGTHYTALATVEVLGKSPASLLSGVIARHLDYAGTFAAAAALSSLFLGLLAPLRRSFAARDAELSRP
jgi:MFS family permease